MILWREFQPARLENAIRGSNIIVITNASFSNTGYLMEGSSSTQHQHHIDYLRGIAALMVCFCHFHIALPEQIGLWVDTVGALGVQIFFVISGYVIPYSMSKSRYEISAIHRFLAKRIVRLHPPFMVALLVTFATSMVAALAKKQTFPLPISDLPPCLFYLKIPAENPVIWSLIVEIKYYLLVAVLFSLLFSKLHWLRRASFFALAALAALCPNFALPFMYLPFFLIGFALCQKAIALIRTTEMWMLIACALLVSIPSASAFQIFAGFSAALFILYFPAIDWRLGSFLGAISYSLYLIHFPLGVKFLNLLLPHVPLRFHFLLFFAAIILVIGMATTLYHLIEKPSCRWSSRIQLKSKWHVPTNESSLPEIS